MKQKPYPVLPKMFYARIQVLTFNLDLFSSLSILCQIRLFIVGLHQIAHYTIATTVLWSFTISEHRPTVRLSM